MKNDIEGAEVLALRGATSTLKRLQKTVQVHNFNFQKVTEILESYNFKLEIIKEDWGVRKEYHGYIIGYR